MGGTISQMLDSEGAEPRGRLSVRSQPLRAVSIDPPEVPGLIDELPVLMVAAACAQGVSVFRGLGELRVKETDRIVSMVAGLERLGARIAQPSPDSVRIEGGKLSAGVVGSAGDHRTAMSLAVAALAAEGRTQIEGSECVRKSYPGFFNDLEHLAGPAAVESD
jgi:3-phosphoshikimate 1-carboxyvinyltransferase